MTAFGDTLRTWRKTRRFSQLSLALEADVSSRHISFLETGRASPSREMIQRLCDALGLPLDARNRMLTAAGFAARYSARAWDEGDMAPVRAAVDHMLRRHAPYPAIAIDGMWTVLEMNGPAVALFGPFGLVEGRSLLDLMLDPDLARAIENWPDVAHHVSRRLRTESAAFGGNARFEEVADALASVPREDAGQIGPVVPTILRMGEARLSLFSTIAQLGTPEDLLLAGLKVEFFFPADSGSAEVLSALRGGTGD